MTTDETIAAEVLRELREGPLSGIAVGITKNGKPLSVQGYGFADLNMKVKITGRTMMRIGSLTKTFTATAILLLAQENKIGLDDEVSHLLPVYSALPKGLAIRHLLTHTAGLPNFTALPGYRSLPTDSTTHDHVVSLITSLPLEFAPGQKYRYSNSGYYLLGLVIEAVTRRSYYDHLDVAIIKPLGMTDTHPLCKESAFPNRALGYKREGIAFSDAEALNLTVPFSAGGLVSTIRDLLLWQQALHTQKILSEQSYALLTTPTLLPGGAPSCYACGMKISSSVNGPRFWHGGSIPGFSACQAYYPERGVAVVVLSNTREANAEEIESRLARLVIEQK